MMEQDHNRSDDRDEDRELRAVLGHASVPGLPAGALERLAAHVAAAPQDARVVRFAPRRRAAPSLWRYVAAVPLAASLALGVWLGANGKMDFAMPSVVTGGVALNDEAPVDDLGGVGEAYAEEGTI